MNLLDKEYVHIGTDNILKELWLDIMMDQIYSLTKPYGGLWCSKQNNYVCDWISYVEDDSIEYFDLISNKPASLIKFDNKTKFLKIENSNDFINLKQSGFVKDLKNTPIKIDQYYYNYLVTHLPDYEKISDYYDLMYINNSIDNCFKQYSIPTMLVLNPNAIKYYKKIKFNNNTITEISNKTFITNPNKDFYRYLKYIENLFKDINEKDYKLFIDILNKMKKDIINNKDNLYNNLGYNLDKNINPQVLLETISNNIYRKKYREKQNILHK